MKNSIKALFLSAATLFCAQYPAVAYDFSALLNPANFAGVDTIHRTPDGLPVFDIRFDSMRIESRKKIWGVRVPQTVVIKDLKLVVHAQNLSNSEIEKIEIFRPVNIEVQNLKLTIIGKKSTLLVVANTAKISPKNIVILSDDASITVAGKSMPLGKSASLSLKGRILYIRSQSGNLGLKL